MRSMAEEQCKQEATCKSPYVEQDEMFCSGNASLQKHKPHWLTEDFLHPPGTVPQALTNGVRSF